MNQQHSAMFRGFDRRAIPDMAKEGVWCASDGQRIRRIDWPAPLKARGSLLFLPGRGDFYEKYLETLGYWHSKGWAVTALDWRGQGSSGLFGQWGEAEPSDQFALWVADLAAFWQSWILENEGPHVLVSHSMGGHISLRAIIEKKVLPDATVLAAPMLGLQPEVIPSSILHWVSRRILKVVRVKSPVENTSSMPLRAGIDRADRLTHDMERYADEAWWRVERPEHTFVPPSWTWIENALASMGVLNSPGVLEGIRIPILLLATQYDRLVSFRAIRKAADRLPKGELVAFGKEGRHELLREVDAVRDRALLAIDQFLDRAVPKTDYEA